MSKNSLNYVCQNCGYSASKWSGKCEACGAWNQMVQESVTGTLKKTKKIDIDSFFYNLQDPDLKLEKLKRVQTGNSEYDRVCGGGMVPGSVILIGGDPGIGKSTLLLQIVSHLSKDYECAYISGEEAVSQIAMRAERLGFGKSSIHLASSTQLKETLSALNQMKKLDVVVIDSIQTLAHENIESAPGSVSQVRACAFELIQLAKKKGFILIMVGHVTKEGTLAGPRVLEHMVDTVLYFEGDRGYDYRLLRSVKNRFGASDELGIFSMEACGLKEVQNPSELFMSHHDEPLSGTAIYAGMEGTRPIMVEIQALVSPSSYAAPKRTTVGWDLNRLSMIVAVLESRCGLSFSGKDIYLSVVGGIKITEPAADLAVAVALISSLNNEADSQTAVYFGEIGLTGEIRPVQKGDIRIREATRLGFDHIVCAKRQFEYTSQFTVSVRELNILLEFLI